MVAITKTLRVKVSVPQFEVSLGGYVINWNMIAVCSRDCLICPTFSVFQVSVCVAVVLLIELSCGLTAETFVTVSVVIIPDSYDRILTNLSMLTFHNWTSKVISIWDLILRIWFCNALWIDECLFRLFLFKSYYNNEPNRKMSSLWFWDESPHYM